MPLTLAQFVKRSSAWDTLVSIANGDGVPIHKVHPAYGNAFHSVTDQDMTGPDGGTVHVGPGEVAYGFERDEPGILAHELGHVKAWGKYGTTRKKITELSRALSNKPILPAALPVAGALASYITKNPAWLTGTSALSLASVAPMLLDEHNANEEGKKLVEQAGGTDEDKDVVSGGLGHKLLRTAGVPAAGLLGGVLLSAMRKKASFEDVKAIYDSLPEEQKRFLDGGGEHVDEKDLNHDAVLTKVVNPGIGYARLWDANSGNNEVEIAVAPKAQGKGYGKEMLQQIIARAKAMKIKKLLYRPHRDNGASRALIRKFVDAPSKAGKDFEEYVIDPANVKDPYEIDLPKGIAEAVDEVKGKYKDLGYDLSDIGAKGSTRSRYESGAVTPFSVMPKKLQVGASWVPTNNSVYFNPDLKAAMKLYGVKGTEEEFARALAAHELAHAVDQRYADEEMRKQLLQEAKDRGFTTPYLDALPFEENRDKEIFAEFLANKVLNKG